MSIINDNKNSTTTSESEAYTHTHVVSLTYTRLGLAYVEGLLKNDIHHSTHVAVCPSVVLQSPMKNINMLFTTQYSTPSGKRKNQLWYTLLLLKFPQSNLSNVW